MKAVPIPLMVIILAISSLALTACNSKGAPPPAYTIGCTVVNLAGTGGAIVLAITQPNSPVIQTYSMPLNANGTFTFAAPVASNSSYGVTISVQPSNPAQTCGVTSGSGIATGNVTTVEVNCGHNEWTWVAGGQAVNQIGTYGTLGTPASDNAPGGRQYPATWIDASGNLWLFGGYGYDSAGNLLPFNDMWKFSAGEWTWVGGATVAGQFGSYGTLGAASPNNIPGARFEPASWKDASGDLWLFGGNGYDSAGNESPMNDLWKYSSGQWTWMGGSNVGLQNSSYGILGVADSNNTPGGRAGTVTWKDASGSIWVFGGLGYDESNPVNGELNDLWRYSAGEWTWMGGPTVKNQPGTYGTQGTGGASNIPGARWGASGWADASGNFWVFGGYGYDSNGAASVLNDLWKYNSGQWTWVSGSKIVNQPGVYGTQGTPAANNIPGARWFGVTWTDSSGNVWLFGGDGFDSKGQPGMLNDLWKFSNGQWTWMGGSNLANATPAYGTQGMIAPGISPGGRFFLAGSVDAKGNLWLFGGFGVPASGTEGNLNDLWMYMP